MSKLSINVVALLAMGGVTACSGILQSNRPPDTEYWLKAVSVESGNEHRATIPGIQVAVRAAPGMDTNRLLSLGPDANLTYYQSARWPDHAPELVESIFRSSLDSTNRYAIVSGGKSSHRSTWRVELELREFFVVRRAADDAGTVKVKLHGYVWCPQGSKSIALESTAPVSENRLPLIVQAFQQSINNVSLSLVHSLDAIRNSNSCF